MLRNWMIALMLAAIPFWANAEASITAPDVLVKETAETIMERIRVERSVIDEQPEHLYALVDEVVLPHFDFEKMSQWVLGKYWRKADTEQRERFISEFRALLVRTYAKALADNSDQQVDYLPLRAKPTDTDVTVNTEVPQEGGFPIPINYSMYLKGDAWKVYDVDIDGISLVANYRTSFAKEVRSNGIDALIEKLASRSVDQK